MVHVGTWIPPISIIYKTILNTWVYVASKIAHGDGDVKFAHYAPDLNPADSNHTIRSFARLLRDLEKPPAYLSRVLFDN